MKSLNSIWQQLFTANLKMPSGILVVLSALTITAPLCNQIFSCGCTWPWLGLDNHCNFHVKPAPVKCPWCVSWLAAGLSLGLALLGGYSLSMTHAFTSRLRGYHYYWQILIRFSLGLSAFIGIAYIGGIVSAIVRNYPLN